MSSFRFIHTADIHLDSGFRGIASREDEAAELVRDATRRAFTGLVDEAIRRRVDFIVIAGDLYDGEWPDIRTAFFVRGELARLREAGVPVYLAKGNHDAEGEVADALPRPENLHVFPSDSPATFEIEEHRVALHGQSFATREITEDLSLRYPDPRPGWFNIGVLHTSCDGRPGHDSYAPCSPEQLRLRDYDYWALGHVHGHEILCEKPPIVFPGCLQGRHPREAGAKGACFVTVDAGRATIAPLHTDVVRWADLTVPLDPAASLADLDQVLRAEFLAIADTCEGRTVIARVNLTGQSVLDGLLRAMAYADLRDRISALASDFRSVFLEQVKLRTRPAAEAPDAPDIGALSPILDELVADPDIWGSLGDELGELRARLPAGSGVEIGQDVETLVIDGRALLAAAVQERTGE